MTYGELPKRPRFGVVLHCKECGFTMPLGPAEKPRDARAVIYCPHAPCYDQRLTLALCNRVVTFCPVTPEWAEEVS